MDTLMVISAVVLAASLIVSLIKFLDWWLNSDPKVVARAGRWLLLLLAAASLPGLAVLLYHREWAGAMLLAAAMLGGLTLFSSGLLRPAFKPLWRDPPSEGRGLRPQDSDADVARRAAEVLQLYLEQQRKTQPPVRLIRDLDGPAREGMSDAEALAVLGLSPGASAVEVRDAHRRLVGRLHPDRGGSDFLTDKVNRARATLLFGEGAAPREDEGGKATEGRA